MEALTVPHKWELSSLCQIDVDRISKNVLEGGVFAVVDLQTGATADAGVLF